MSDFRVGKNQETLPEYFSDSLAHAKVTRGELRQILGLFADKASMQKGFDEFAFTLRQTVRKAVDEERERQKEGLTEGGLYVPPGAL